MRYADPLTVTCPTCKGPGSYATRELIALRARCAHCSASLESVGRRMRARLADVRSLIRKTEVSFELEDMFGVTFTDAEVESIRRPLDFAQYLEASQRRQKVEAGIVEALARIRRAPVGEGDLRKTFGELFPFDADTYEPGDG